MCGTGFLKNVLFFCHGQVFFNNTSLSGVMKHPMGPPERG